MSAIEPQSIGLDILAESGQTDIIPGEDKIIPPNIHELICKNRRRCNPKVKTCLLVFGLSVAIGSILLLLVFVTQLIKGETAEARTGIVIIYLSVYLPNAPYHESYTDPSSQRFTEFENIFCGNVSLILQHGTVSGYAGCQVTELRKGSVLVSSKLTYEGEVDQTNTTLGAITHDLQTNLTYNGQAVVEAEFVSDSLTTTVQLPVTQTTPNSAKPIGSTQSSTSTTLTTSSTILSTSTSSTSITSQWYIATQSSTPTSTTANRNTTCGGITCQNEGYCILNDVDAHCFCRAGYTGALCETEIDECASNPCQNNGTCVDKVNSYDCFCAICGCADEEAGPNCEYDVSGCKDKPNGNYPHPDNCTLYRSCVGENLYERDCNNRTYGTDLVFDPSLGICNRRDNVTCSSKNLASCDNRSDGDYPYPHDCSKYIRCKSEEANVLYCETGTKFNPHTNNCGVDHLC